MKLEVNIKKCFAQHHNHFELDVSFVVDLGITVLFGPSGSGKSTTLNCIAGIATPDIGYIRLSNKLLFETAKINLPLRQRKVGYVFQRLGLFEHLCVLKNVMYGLSHLPNSSRLKKATNILKQFGIEHLSKSYPSQLSGGERQRVALARTLVTEPEVLLLDEPFSALDRVTKYSLLNELKSWKLNIPVLYVSHDVEEVINIGQRIITYEEGNIIADNSVDIFAITIKSQLKNRLFKVDDYHGATSI